MKLFLEPITVQEEAGKPRRIRWRNQEYVVERIVDYWIWQAEWWGTFEKRYYVRVLTNRGMLEIFRSDGEWVLSRQGD